ncbi:hydrogenase maturation protease [Flavivirga rizhaonensis]|uniref:Hydrogenase maturation protease n=1 Tax=Flavivirga rizhaonensis TaxID=2559571 RepID=A0A4S1DVL8_9FLAO|nr:hydrogenase maturation protease [Flavivirga rizhaonensis]TGV02156.1 hydrogenase maturation protease [Flavivirga rizhaonensis]
MKKEGKYKTIVFGIGNTGRQDDGLGWLFLDFLKTQNPHMDLEYRYQLQIEDAELILNYETVIFIDATKEDTGDGFYFKTCKPSEAYSFSTHALKPETILHLTNTLYYYNPKAFILGIQGYQWELEIGISKKAKININKAKDYFKKNVIVDCILTN